MAHELARWVESLRFEDLSPRAIELAHLFWLDSLACAVGGSRTEDARILLDHHRAMNPHGGPSTALVTGFRTNPVDAAFLNSHMVRAMDFNDIYWKADPAHPSDLICGPLALAEARHGTGRDLILATVILYELQCRFAEIGRPGIREYGWHHATLSGFAAGLGAGKMLCLDAERLTNAIGICASRTGTLGAVTAGHLTMMKNTVDPWAARMGVESALLAERGYTGPAHIIDGKEGLFHVFGHARIGASACGFDAATLTRDLPSSPGSSFRIETCGLKSFPVEALMHSPLSALTRLRAAHRFDPRDVAEIRVEVIARAADILGDPAKYRPATRETADHSLPYAIAVGLVDGIVGPSQFDEHRIHDPALHTVIDAVRVIPNDSFEQRFPASQPSRVTITLRSGAEMSAEVEYPKGDPRNPMSWTEVVSKFRGLADGVLAASSVDRIADLVSRLESLPDVAMLIASTQPEGHRHT